MKEDNKPGWLYTTEADLLAYYFAKVDILYLIPFGPLKSRFEENKHRYRESSTKTAGAGYTTVFRLAKLEDVETAISTIVKVVGVAEKLGLKEIRQPG